MDELGDLTGITAAGPLHQVALTHDVEAAAKADAVAVMSQGHLVQWTDCRDARQIAELVHSARATRAA